MQLHVLFTEEVESLIEEETESASYDLLVDEIAEKAEKWQGISFSDLLSTYVPQAVDFILRIVLALIIFWVGVKLIRWLVRLCDKGMEKQGVELTVRRFLRYVLLALGYIALAMILLQTVGLAVTSLAAAFASAGVAIGLALQGSLSNFAGGILILVTKPFVIGDYIVQGSNEGTVKEIGLVYTKLVTIDNRMIMIPNGTLSDTSVVNVSANPTRRLDLTVGISYESDLKLAKEVLRKIAEQEETRLSDEEITVYVSELGESSVVLGLRYWVSTADYWTTRWRTIERIKLDLEAAGVVIAYNQLDVHLEEKENVDYGMRGGAAGGEGGRN